MAPEKHPATGIEPEYTHPFNGIQNFRDVGVTVNEFLCKRVMREGYLFRSGRLDEATDEDKRKFKEEYGIRTVFDLRTDTERIVRSRRNPGAYGNGQSPNAVEPIVGVETHKVYIIGRNLEKAMLKMLGWWSLFKVIVFMIFGFRISAVKIVSKEVIEGIGLVGMGTLAIQHSGSEIKRMFEILTSNSGESPYPVIAHCTQGKDRTGLVILLILLCLQTPSSGTDILPLEITLAAISHDYALTQAGLRRIRTEMMEEIVNDAGLPPSFVNVDPGFVESVVEFLENRYGGLEGYLASLGLDPVYVIGRLRQTFLVNG